MGRLVDQVRHLTAGYVRKGGKRNRRQQRNRMLTLAAHFESQGARDLGQVGKRHVVRFWKAHRHLGRRTLYGYHRAAVTLWRLAGKTGQPPEPRYPD